MARIVVELTNRCNLRCRHCFDERHAATGDLPLEILDKVLLEGKRCGIDQVCFTGGEPTVHRRFAEIVHRVCAADFPFSLVSNGASFGKIYPLLLEHRERFRGVTFSLDGAREATHDRLRGKGSYRQVMRAATIGVFEDIPFTFNMVLTRHNRGEVEEMIELAAGLGSGGVRFGHLMATRETAARELDLSPRQRREVEAEIWRLRAGAPVPVGMAPGYFSESPFFPCGPLELEEYNLDYRGNLTLCCQLSGQSGANSGSDVVGNLHEVSLAEACGRFRSLVAAYLAAKRQRVDRGELTELDHFPCWYCAKTMNKVAGLEELARHPWTEAGPTAGRSDGETRREGPTPP